MSITYGFYNSINHDRMYDATQFSQIFDGIVKDGVYAHVGNKFAVTANSAMIVNVGTGRAWFHGTWTLNDGAVPLVLDDSDLVYNRIDIVALRIDTRNSIRANSLVVVKGTPASSPVAPDLANGDGVYEYPLAHIYIGHGVHVIEQSMITNKVGTSACPYVTGVLETISADQIIAQWEAEFNVWFSHLHNELDEHQAAHLQNEIDALTENTDFNWTTTTLSAGNWTTSGSLHYYDLDSIVPSSTYDIWEVTVNVGTASSAQIEAFGKAMVGGCTNGTPNKITARSVKPTIDIPVSICYKKKESDTAKTLISPFGSGNASYADNAGYATTAGSASRATLANNAYSVYANGFIIEKKRTGNYSVDINVSGSLDVTKTGYKPIAIVGTDCGLNSYVHLHDAYIDDHWSNTTYTYTIEFSFVGSGSQTYTNQYVDFYVLYVPVQTW